MTEGIRSPNGNPAKLVATSIKKKPEDAAKERVEISLRRLKDSVQNNAAAGAELRRLSSEPAPKREGLEEVKEANLAASKVSVEDVEEFTQRLAEEISRRRAEAAWAHRAPSRERVQDLLKE